MKSLLHIVLLASLVLAAAACNDDSCYDNGNSLPLVKFYQSGSGAVTVSGVTLRGIGAPGDSIYASNESLSETYMPLRATTTSTQWVIEVATSDSTTIADTLTVNYTPVPYFAGSECGAMYKFDLGTVTCTGNAIDSVVVIQSEVTNVSQETLRIYFKS